MVYLQKALYQAGLSVVNISSPTQADFMTNASSSSVPGYMKADVQDLYTAIRKVYADIEKKVEVSEFYTPGRRRAPVGNAASRRRGRTASG